VCTRLGEGSEGVCEAADPEKENKVVGEMDELREAEEYRVRVPVALAFADSHLLPEPDTVCVTVGCRGLRDTLGVLDKERLGDGDGVDVLKRV